MAQVLLKNGLLLPYTSSSHVSGAHGGVPLLTRIHIYIPGDCTD